MSMFSGSQLFGPGKMGQTASDDWSGDIGTDATDHRVYHGGDWGDSDSSIDLPGLIDTGMDWFEKYQQRRDDSNGDSGVTRPTHALPYPSQPVNYSNQPAANASGDQGVDWQKWALPAAIGVAGLAAAFFFMKR